MRRFALFVFLITCAPAAVRADEPPPAGPPPAPSPAHPPAVEDRMAALGGEWVTSGRSPGPVFGLDLLLGQQTGLRPSIAVFSTPTSAVFVEGYYGALLTKLGTSEAAGAGGRWVTTRGGGNNSVTIGPGVDVLFHFNRGKAVILAPTVDVAWRHGFGDRAAFFLGINAGVGIGLSGREGNDRDGDPASGRVTPLISFYTGLRF